MLLIGQLPGQSFAKFIRETSIIPKCLLTGLAETRPDAFPDIFLSQIPKYCAGIVDLICE